MTYLQTLILASTFLIFVSRLSSAYNFMGLAASAATQLGLLSHTSDSSLQHTRTANLTIATLINIDSFLSIVLGVKSVIPRDVAVKKMEDQRMNSTRIDRESLETCQQDQDTSQALEILKRNFDILQLTVSTLQHFHDPSTPRSQGLSHSLGVDETVLRNAARELGRLTPNLGCIPSPPSDHFNGSTGSSDAAKSGGEFEFYWSQLSMNVPFLHYLRLLADGHPIPDSASRPALTCLKIAVNVITRCEVLLHPLAESDAYSQFMHPGNWTCIYTVFLAVVALIFLISIHEGTSKPNEAWRKADSGIRVLAALRCGDRGATPCLAVVRELVRQLNYTVDFNFENIEKTTRRVCERHTKLPTLSNILGSPSTQTSWSSPRETVSSPGHLNIGNSGFQAMSSADRMLALAQSLLLKTDAPDDETDHAE